MWRNCCMKSFSLLSSVTNKIINSTVATLVYVEFPLSSSHLSGVTEVRSLAFMSSSLRCSLFCSSCRPVSAVLCCAICVAQSALFSFAQFMSSSQRCSLLCSMGRPVRAVLFSAICVAQSVLFAFVASVSRRHRPPIGSVINYSIENHIPRHCAYLRSIRN
jgi:hypothetical protein